MSETAPDENDFISPNDAESYEVRITTHGKMAAWVDFALDFLNKHETRPLTFHTLPANAVPSDAPTLGHVEDPKRSRMCPATLLIPRLVSVVEIIKREYLKALHMTLAEKGTLSGLHQYNELSSMTIPNEEVVSADTEAERARTIALAVSGKNYPALKKRNAYMKITLCRTQLPHLLEKQGVTYQKPAVRRLSKSAKARARKRLQREQQPQTTQI